MTSLHQIPALETSWLIRYRFGEQEELRRHLRVGSTGAGFLFLADPLLPFSIGSCVVLEVSFEEREHRSLFHGSVRSRERDGLWLELPRARAAISWLRATEKPRRAGRRISADLLAEVRIGGRPASLCRVIDLGTGGARLSCGPTDGTFPGDELEITLLPPEPGLPSADVRARVAWLGRREIGLAFREPPPELRDLLCILEARWDHSDLLSHPPSCPCAATTAVSPEPPAYWLAD